MLPNGSRAVADALAKQFEGCRLAPYLDDARPRNWTIGWGSRTLLNGAPVTGATSPITQAMADAMFDAFMATIEPKLDGMLTVPVSANQAGALLSMTYNIGSGAMARSNVIAAVNRGDVMGAANCMLQWDHTGNVENAGLLRRRTAERAVFLTADGALNPPQPVAPPAMLSDADTLMETELRTLGHAL